MGEYLQKEGGAPPGFWFRLVKALLQSQRLVFADLDGKDRFHLGLP